MQVNPIGLKMLGDVAVNVSVELGSTQMPLRDVLALTQESVILLDRLTDELLDVMVNGKPIAKAEVIAQDGRFAMRIVELAGEEGGGEEGGGEEGGGEEGGREDAPSTPASAPLDSIQSEAAQ